MFINNTDTVNNDSEESGQNFIKVAERYYKAFDQNKADAQYIIGNLYYNGKGVIQDYREAMEWFLQAANNNHAPGTVFYWSYVL